MKQRNPTVFIRQAGERRYVCDKCGDEYTEVILAPGHSYAITDSYSENGKTTRVYTCTVCGDTYVQEMGDQYEEVSSYVEELFEQYRPYMIWVFLGTAAIWSIVMGSKEDDRQLCNRACGHFRNSCRLPVPCPWDCNSGNLKNFQRRKECD